MDSTQPFNFTLAAAYAMEKWKAEFRAEWVLFLPLAVQWQLCKTHSMELIGCYKALTYGDRAGTTKAPALVGRVRKVMNTWARSTRGVLCQELADENLWLAREMLGAKAAAREIGILAGLMYGTKALEPSTVRNKLNGLDTRLAAA